MKTVKRKKRNNAQNAVSKKADRYKKGENSAIIELDSAAC